MASSESKQLDRISGLLLTDPNFNKTAQIEILLGVSVHASIIEGDVRRGALTGLIAMSSKLG